MSKQSESGYFKKYYQDNKEYFRQRHIDGYHKEYRTNNKEYHQKYRNDNKDRLIDYWLKRNYNITFEEYNKLFAEQEGKCAICGVHQNDLKKKLSVDHNHETGEIRGLLCNSCNLSLGHAKEDTKILLKMIDYLNKEIEALNLQEKITKNKKSDTKNK
jgi:hypothetical protein